VERVPQFHLSDGWWQSFAAAYSDRPVLATDLPCGRIRTVEARDAIGPFRFRSLQSATNLQTCYFDIEEDRGTAGALASLPERLLADSRAAQLRFDWLREGSRLLKAAEGWVGRYPVLVEQHALSPVVDCTTSFEDYLARCGKSVRKYWRTCRREVLDRGSLAVEFVGGGPEVGEILQEMLELEAAGWKGRNGTAILNSPSDTQFYTRLAFAAAEAGALRLALLREGARLVAFEFCIVSEGVVMAMKVGYDETRSRLQLGHLIALLNIRDACGRAELRYYDMLSNSLRIADYKKRFATHCWPVYRVRLFAPTLMGKLLHAAFRGRLQLKALRERLRGVREVRA
jgi:CelD/BcsL family acetyltransferase involved in cellulose biosynthesis